MKKHVSVYLSIVNIPTALVYHLDIWGECEFMGAWVCRTVVPFAHYSCELKTALQIVD